MGSYILEDAEHQGQAALSGLSSSRSNRRLEQIASLRARGIGDHISLPQLVVCGDQSAGKSSVLEGITGLPFPKKDGLCTRFATEITLTHAEEPMEIVADVIPSPTRLDETRAALLAYNRKLDNFNELPQVIAEAGALMCVRGFGNNESGPAFARDVLRIKVSGRIGLHLSVVDLPGLIAVPSEDQIEADVEAVHDLVDSYVKNTRTIILAVVQASNDVANQSIIRKSKKFDLRGERTIGVITKPDLLNAGTESRIAALAKNEGTTRLKLGFFLLKNPYTSDPLDAIDVKDRESREKAYFASSPWRELDLDDNRTGIIPLRKFLQRHLDQHIEKELPKVREDVKQLIRKTNIDLAKLGEARPTIGHVRVYLSKIAMHFHNLTAAALQGDYHRIDAAFFERFDGPSDRSRLRAVVHNANAAFANELRDRGQTMKVVENQSDGLDIFSDLVDSHSAGPINISSKEMRKFVMNIYRRSRGKELPGNYNHVVLAELFHHQAKRWKLIAAGHLAVVFNHVMSFLKDVALYITNDSRVSTEIIERISAVLDETRKRADEELEKLWLDHSQQPITYNHYYTDTIQNARSEASRKWLKQAIEEMHPLKCITRKCTSVILPPIPTNFYKHFNVRSWLTWTNERVQKCSQISRRIIRKTFVDNICIQVVERHILRGLPDVFSPEIVAGFSDEELQCIAGEEREQIVKRGQLESLRDNLVAALRDLQN